MVDPATASAIAESGAELSLPIALTALPAQHSAHSAAAASVPPVPYPISPEALAQPATTTVTQASAVPRGTQDRPILLVLVGLPGSGKTTFGNALVAACPGWVRCSQDESASGRRQEVEAAVRAALLAGQNVIVDRVNFDPTQRGHFLAIAQQTGARPLSIVLKAPFDVLRQRLLDRTDHPTLKDAETALKVLGRMRRELVYPQTYEGFQRVLFVDSEGDWTKERLEDTLEKLEKEGTTGQRPRRGGYGGGYRGHGGHGGHGEGRGGSWGGYRGGHSGPRDGPPAPRGGFGGFGGRGYQPAPRGGHRGMWSDRGRGGYSRGGYHGDRPAGNAPYRAHAGHDGPPRNEYRGDRGGEHAFPISSYGVAAADLAPSGPSTSQYDSAALPPRPPQPVSGPGAAGDAVTRE